MIDINWIKRNQIFIVLGLIILILATLKIKYGYKGEVINSNQKIITPTIKIEPSISIKNEYPLQNKLPYYGKGFVVDKYTAPMTLRMILNGATEQQATKDVGKWIDSFGDAIGQHKIEIQN